MQRNAARLSPRPDKLRIKSVLREKPGVRAPLDDSSLVKDQDEVRAAYGGKPVSDDECGALPRESGQCALHACFRDGMDRASITVKKAATLGISMNIWLMKRPTCSRRPIRREANPMNVTI